VLQELNELEHRQIDIFREIILNNSSNALISLQTIDEQIKELRKRLELLKR
jgi:hypothetical protein